MSRLLKFGRHLINARFVSMIDKGEKKLTLSVAQSSSYSDSGVTRLVVTFDTEVHLQNAILLLAKSSEYGVTEVPGVIPLSS